MFFVCRFCFVYFFVFRLWLNTSSTSLHNRGFVLSVGCFFRFLCLIPGRCFSLCCYFYCLFLFSVVSFESSCFFFRFVFLSSTSLQYSRSLFSILSVPSAFWVCRSWSTWRSECALEFSFVLLGFGKLPAVVFNSFSCLHSCLFSFSLFRRNKQHWKKKLLSNRILWNSSQHRFSPCVYEPNFYGLIFLVHKIIFICVFSSCTAAASALFAYFALVPNYVPRILNGCLFFVVC